MLRSVSTVPAMKETMPESGCGNRINERRIVVKLPNDTLQVACQRDIDYDQEEGATADNMDPSLPFLVVEKFDWDKAAEWMDLKSAWIAKSIPNDIIIPDPTPKSVRDAFLDISARLNLVLRKDSVRFFLRLFAESPRTMAYKFTITSETLTYMVRHNALRCAKVVLEGKAPELGSMHANPNCVNWYGYFPLHEAAQRFSVDMIKLLFRHGASAKVGTVGDSASIQDLLPLHVAIENTCMHKYLEDNLSPFQYCEDHIYKLIYLLCLPEMKVFLDTTRLLAEKTDNLVHEVWNYMKHSKLTQTAVLFLPAQKRIREGGKTNGFYIITHRMFKEYDTLIREKLSNTVTQEQLEKRRAFLYWTSQLVSIIAQAGKDLDKYIQAHSDVPHSEVPHVEVFARVSSILKEYGFCPKEECIDTLNLRPYNWTIRELHYKGHIDATKAVVKKKLMHSNVTDEFLCSLFAVRNKVLRGWDPKYRRRKFFPWWRSVLGALCLSYAAADDRSVLDLG